MFKTLFCQLLFLVCFSYTLLGQTKGGIEPESETPPCPLVFDIVIEAQESTLCEIPSQVCNESPAISGLELEVIQPIMVDPDYSHENGGIGYFPFGIKLDPWDGHTVPLFLKVIPVSTACGGWDVRIISRQTAWGFWDFGNIPEDLNLGISATNNISELIATINFRPIEDGEHFYMSMVITLPMNATRFSTYSYCERDDVIDCSAYRFPDQLPDPDTGFDPLGPRLVSGNEHNTAATLQEDNLLLRTYPQDNTPSSTIESFMNFRVVNPFREAIDVYLPQVLSQSAELILYSMNGKQLQQLQLSPGNDHYQLSTSDLPSGTYLIRLIVGDEVQSKMIVKG